MREQAAKHERPLPYLLNNYQVSAHYEHPLSSTRNTLSRFYNSFVKALNQKNKHLPRMIIVVPDWDILKFIDHYSYGITNLSGKCLDWLLRNMERAIESRKEQLRRRRAGAVQPNEPKIIWVTMINRPQPQKILAVRRKFNSTLENLLVNRRYHYILDISDTVLEGHNFTYNNLLNTRGEQVFWSEIDDKIEKFDLHKESLHPQEKLPEIPNEQKAKPIQQVPPRITGHKPPRNY